MGTNYYLIEKPPCESCGRPYDRLHIGKSSAGWCFSLHVDADNGINDLSDWQIRWERPGAYIEDEYGNMILPEDMLSEITHRCREPSKNPPYGYPSWSSFHAENHSQPGPNGMLRYQIDGRYCLGHGAGTWDLIPGDFS